MTSNPDEYYSGAIDIPATVTYNDITYSVTSIGYQAFRDCSGLTYDEVLIIDPETPITREEYDTVTK